jgi:hypothetical protein
VLGLPDAEERLEGHILLLRLITRNIRRLSLPVGFVSDGTREMWLQTGLQMRKFEGFTCLEVAAGWKGLRHGASAQTTCQGL